MRRIGSSPAERGSTGYNNCPDVFEVPTGDFLVIGKVVLDFDARFSAERLREMGASVGPDEEPVLVPRECLLAAAKQLAAEGVIG